MSLFQFSQVKIPKLLGALWAMRSDGHFMGGYSNLRVFCSEERSCFELREVDRRMIDSYVAGISYLGNNLGMTLMRKDPSLSSAVDLQNSQRGVQKRSATLANLLGQEMHSTSPQYRPLKPEDRITLASL